jgi:cytochrome P450
LGCQTGWNPLADSLLNQISWKISNQEVNPLQWLNFVRTIVEWYNGRKMDAYIDKEVDKRFKAYQQKTDDSDGKFESIIDLALQDYMADPSRVASKELDKDFRTFATRNIRMLLFAGHDSTGSTISYCHYLLSQNPEALALLRAEHDRVLGTDLSNAALAISNDPHLLNKLPYTNAVIKEALRLFPPAASIRQGLEGIDLIDEDGNHYPTAECMVYILHGTMQRDAKNFIRPKEFLPERWLADPEDPLYPSVKGSWRPFEYGPRNCIGQLMVMLEVRAVLALTVREFDIKPAYEEWDALNPKKGLRMVDGERAYQIDEGAAHPADHFPCRAFLRDGK